MSQFYFGIVENRLDPLRMGRCQVRIVGVHTEDLAILPTSDLPWAMPITPITTASVSGIGETPLGPVEGSRVLIIFSDENEKQNPLMMGTIPGMPIIETDIAKKVSFLNDAVQNQLSDVFNKSKKPTTKTTVDDIGFKDPSGKYPKNTHLGEPDLNRLSRGQLLDETIIPVKQDNRRTGVRIACEENGNKWDQPPITYVSRYPYNHVYESESGHIREVDDTPGAERLMDYHRAGTYTEIDKHGTQINRVVGSSYEIIDRDGFVSIKGQCVVNVAGHITVMAQNDVFLEVLGKTNVYSHGHLNMKTDGDFTAIAAGSMNFICKDYKIEASTVSWTIANKVDIKVSGYMNVDASYYTQNSKASEPKVIDRKTWSYFPINSIHKFV